MLFPLFWRLRYRGREWREYPWWFDSLYLSLFAFDMAGNSLGLYNSFSGAFNDVTHTYGNGALTIVLAGAFGFTTLEAMGLATMLHLVLQVRVYQEPMDYASSVLQPIMVFYSLSVILCACWLASRWASHLDQEGYPKGYRIWHVLSDASFGVYLIHALILTALLRWVVPAMPAVWPVAVRVFLTWSMVAGGATLMSVILLHIPVLSRLVGRAHPAQRKAVQPARGDKYLARQRTSS